MFKYISCTDLFVHILGMNCVFSCYRDIYLGYIETILCFQSFSNSKAFFSGVAKSLLCYTAYRDHFVFSAVFKRKRVFFCRRCKEPGQASECWSAQDGFTGVPQSHRCLVLYPKKAIIINKSGKST